MLKNHQYLLSLFVLGYCLSLGACQKDSGSTTPTNPSTQLYFPDKTAGSTWETMTPAQAGFDATKLENLYAYLEQNNTRAFIILKDGKIVAEKYFNNDFLGRKFSATSNWYWASAGKTLTSFLIGKAEEENFLGLSHPSNHYLGTGWSSLTAAQETAITVRHHVTMTTGLNDGVSNPDCTTPNCMQYLAAAGSRWAYHNAPYTILDKIIEGATKQSFSNYFNSRLRDKIGMDGTWQKTGDNNVYYSTPRSMARFGLLILAKGKWQNETILGNTTYYNDMLNTSQNLNLSYGYLWWLNGKTSFMVPTLQTVFPRMMSPQAPTDMVAAMGKNGQLINIVPSKNLVVVRMGDSPDNSLVPFTFQDELWKRLVEAMNK